VKNKTDFRSEPIKKMLAFGESTTWGYSVSDISKCWVNRLASVLQEFQTQEIEVINQGIGSNVLTPLCPAYEISAKPCAMERLDGDVLAYRPDLLILAYGLNDSRGGTPVEVFRAEYQKIIDKIRDVYNPLIVVVNVFRMHEYMYKNCMTDGWKESDYDVTELFNLALKQFCDKNELILADVYSSQEGVDWFTDEDHAHPNDLGHMIIANKVFEAIARNASFVANNMPKETLILDFMEKYGNGPQLPSIHEPTSDAVFQEVVMKFQEEKKRKNKQKE